MANRGLHEFTVQEANNFSSYRSYESTKQTMNDSVKYFPSATTNWANNPAKKVVLYNDGTGDDTDYIINLKIAGDADYGNNITLDAGDLPLTIEGLLIESIKIISTDDVVACLSFH
jgi:hypothetical protein